ncbi:hypothetical protein CAI21_19210 [Alkalilimnicola ehrlichii]|uniref:Exlusion protein FxsA n=1 Tax=Alkalilimnicola ehrlichii TaxID=351052 RepID=A0A3E0WHZ8_9GAMM|nr:FxsA family protein [Alkalilimnicola ehrlichii]RFA25367.1 hypothetical protein CAI21_19210 [Alkalilimnicola ehrlichii]RFA32544.1 hypothetical protein CAL65_19475 [Alkalilimnicola ehrlichii]
MPIFILLFLIVPFVEIYLLIQVGQVIGALPTIGLCVLTAVLGGALLRQQGVRTMARARHNLDQGQLPAHEMLEGIALGIGGALLVTPGFATDAVGFMCLLPFTRRWLVSHVLRRVTVVSAMGAGAYDSTTRRPQGREADGSHIIEGEYERKD